MKLKDISEQFCVTTEERLLYNICELQKEILSKLEGDKNDMGRDKKTSTSTVQRARKK